MQPMIKEATQDYVVRSFFGVIAQRKQAAVCLL